MNRNIIIGRNSQTYSVKKSINQKLINPSLIKVLNGRYSSFSDTLYNFNNFQRKRYAKDILKYELEVYSENLRMLLKSKKIEMSDSTIEVQY